MKILFSEMYVLLLDKIVGIVRMMRLLTWQKYIIIALVWYKSLLLFLLAIIVLIIVL